MEKKVKVAKPFRNTCHLLSESMSEQVRHGEQVSVLAYEVGKELGLDEQACRDLVIAGFFHDIGKTSLQPVKPGDNMMLVEEMNSIREHPRKGSEILRRHGFSESICTATGRMRTGNLWSRAPADPSRLTPCMRNSASAKT